MRSKQKNRKVNFMRMIKHWDSNNDGFRWIIEQRDSVVKKMEPNEGWNTLFTREDIHVTVQPLRTDEVSINDSFKSWNGELWQKDGHRTKMVLYRSCKKSPITY